MLVPAAARPFTRESGINGMEAFFSEDVVELACCVKKWKDVPTLKVRLPAADVDMLVRPFVFGSAC